MTFRRVMLVVLPTLGAVFAFMALRWVYVDWESSLLGRAPFAGGRPPPMPVGREAMTTIEDVRHEVTEDVDLLRRGRDRRLEMRFRAKRVEHREADTADVTRPQIQYFAKGGEIITLLAEQASVVTKGSLLKMGDIESGRLWGNVILIHDRGTPDDDSDDILVSMDELAFNNEIGELTTDGPVLLVGLEMDLSARRMRIALNPDTGRIDAMTFYEDVRISMSVESRAGAGLFSIGTEPGTAEPPASPATPAPAPAAPAPASPPQPPKAPVPAAPSAPASAAPPSPSGPGNLWRIDLKGDVVASQGDQRLGCDFLSLYSTAAGPGEGETPVRSESASSAASPVAGGAASAASPAAAAGPDAGGSRSDWTPAPGSAEAPPDGRDLARPDGGGPNPALQGQAFRRARFLQPGAAPPLVVVGRGPLMITPVSAAERQRLGDEVDRLVAKGAPATVIDRETRIVGREIHYNTRTGAGTVLGTAEAPILLEQPPRLRLTGRSLEFDRRRAFMDVSGQGQLHALAEAADLPSARRQGPTRRSGPPEASALDASWTEGMRLEFYRLAADSLAGTEVKRALFRGQAEILQQQGLLQGDEVEVHFFRPLAEGRSQAVERLIGHGNVFVRNAQGQAAPAAGRAAAEKTGQGALGDITCQFLDMGFRRDPTGEVRPEQLTASSRDPSGRTQPRRPRPPAPPTAEPLVIINDAEGRIQARDLVARFEVTPEGSDEVRFLDARGKVIVDRKDLHAEGDRVLRDLAAGRLLLEGQPARAERGQSRVVGPSIEFAQEEGRARVTGAGELQMPATTDFRGRPQAQPKPLLVRWKKGMLFEDARNFAQFDGTAVATLGSSELRSERLWIYFADRPDAAAPRRDKAPLEGGDVSQLFGRKALVRMLAEKAVHAVERQPAADGTLQFQMEIVGDNLTYVEENRKAYMRGPGRLGILARERPRQGQPAALGLPIETAEPLWTGPVADGYSRTLVAWADSMAYDGSTERAYFEGRVDAQHEGRGVPGSGAARSRRNVTSTRVKSSTLQVLFSEKKEAPAAAPAAPPAPREDRMAVEKFVADGGVLLWVDDRRGSAERVIYQRDPEMIRLYRGTEDWARLWQEDEASQQFGEIVARVITYDPSTGRVDMVDQQTMTISPKPARP